MSDKEDAEKWRLEQDEELLKLFEEDTGAPAASMEELTAWRSSDRGKFVIETKARLLKKKDHTQIQG
jgi:hypothetical protein